MAIIAQKAERKSFETPEEVRPFPFGRLDVVTAGGVTVGRGVFQPGWKWSESVKPIAKTESCQASHIGYVVSGSMTAKMEDGEMQTFRAGEVMSLPPGHDAWVEGNEQCIVIDFGGYEQYAKPM